MNPLRRNSKLFKYTSSDNGGISWRLALGPTRMNMLYTQFGSYKATMEHHCAAVSML
jgi:hypothetical protein